MSRRLILILSLVSMSIVLASGCARLASRATLLIPESARKVHTVMIWPFPVLPYDRAIYKHPKLVEYLMNGEESFYTPGGELEVIATRTLTETLDSQFVLLTRYRVSSDLPDVAYACQAESCSTVYESCRTIGADGVIFVNIQFTRGSNGQNTYVVLRMFDTATRQLVATASHNTAWGNSYFSYPEIDNTLPDGVRGAARALRKALNSEELKPPNQP